MAGGGAWDYQLKTKRAFNYAFAIRGLLDNCKTTREAVKMLENMPANTSTHYLISDKLGNAAIVEGIDCEYAVREINAESDEQPLFSTSYHRSKKLGRFNKYVNNYLEKINKMRDDRTTEFITKNTPNIMKDMLKELNTKEKPQGICTLHYSEWFGVL